MSEGPFTQAQLEQLKTIVFEGVQEALADSGLRIDEPAHQDEAREDFRFVRKLRRGVDGIASKIGWAIIAAVLGGVVWLVQAGLQAWKAMT